MGAWLPWQRASEEDALSAIQWPGRAMEGQQRQPEEEETIKPVDEVAVKLQSVKQQPEQPEPSQQEQAQPERRDSEPELEPELEPEPEMVPDSLNLHYSQDMSQIEEGDEAEYVIPDNLKNLLKVTI